MIRPDNWPASAPRGHHRIAPARAAAASAQSGTTASAPASAQATIEDDPDLDLSIEQPDFTIITLPTTLRLPRFKSAFRVTHRFGRPLGVGDFGDLAGDLFGLDSGAQIGLEYRFGLMRGLQAGIHRTSNKTIEFFGQYNVLQQGGRRRSASACWRRSTAPTTSATSTPPRSAWLCRGRSAEHGALYVEPIWVKQQQPRPRTSPVIDNDTVLIGLAARLRVRPTVYLVGEMTPARVRLRPRRDARHVRASKNAPAVTRSS